MPHVTRTVATLAAPALLGASAFADFTGIDLREDKGAIPPAHLAAIDPMGLGVRIINFYATFDGAGSWTEDLPRSPNAVLNVGGDAFLDQSWRIDKRDGQNADAGFYQDPNGGNFAPTTALIGLFPTLEWDTYVGFGTKVFDAPGMDITGAAALFEFIDQDMDGRGDGITSGWFVSNPTVEQSVATFNSDSGEFEVFLAQLTIVGLDAGARLGQLRSGLNSEGRLEWESDIFTGEYSVFTQRPTGGAIRWDIDFVEIPAPGTLALLAPAGVVALRRRRSV